MDAVKNLLFSFLRRFLESIDITSGHFLVDTSELFSIIFCFTVLFPSSNSCNTNIANYAYVRRFICRIVYILSFFLFSLIDNSLHNYAEILSDFARICRKRQFLSHMFCWNSLKRDWKTEEIGGEDGYISYQCAIMLYGREKMRLAFSQMRLAVGGDSPCFSRYVSRILEKARRILISVPDTGYNLFALSAISASSADEEFTSAFFRRQYL